MLDFFFCNFWRTYVSTSCRHSNGDQLCTPSRLFIPLFWWSWLHTETSAEKKRTSWLDPLVLRSAIQMMSFHWKTLNLVTMRLTSRNWQLGRVMNETLRQKRWLRFFHYKRSICIRSVYFSLYTLPHGILFLSGFKW